jgi:hypothetical protein
MQATIKSIARSLKDGPYVWPGGYRKLYYTSCGDVLCHDCALLEYGALARNTYNECFAGVDAYWEGPTIQCAACNCDLESEYGDPDSED